MKMRTNSTAPYLFVLLMLCSGCKSFDDKLLEYRPAEELYAMAEKEMNEKNYAKAAKMFDEVDRQHPYSTWAPKAQLMNAYALYQHQKYDEASIQFDTFLQLHPGHSETAYANYMLGMCYYEQINYTARDSEPSTMALNTFHDVIDRYPGSSYSQDAKHKLQLVEDHLASKEMEIGRYYLKQGGYGAALVRFKAVMDTYPQTPQIQEALYRMVETYLALDLKTEAWNAGVLLGHNYPESKWYHACYDLLKNHQLDVKTAQPDLLLNTKTTSNAKK